MKIKLIFEEDKNLRAVEKRFYAAADAHGVSHEAALVEAMLYWLHMVPSGSDFTLDVTGAEWGELRPLIAEIQARHRADGSSPSSEAPVS